MGSRFVRARSKRNFLISFFCLLDEHAHNAGGHEVRHGSREHRAQAELGKLVATVWDQGADAADLHPDRTKICEAAERKRSNGERARRESSLLQTELSVSDEFVEDRTRSKQVAYVLCLAPGYADEPRHRCANHPKDGVERVRKWDVPVRPGEVRDAEHNGVDQAHEREEADEHDGNVEG